jgi:hypothetical protein
MTPSKKASGHWLKMNPKITAEMQGFAARYLPDPQRKGALEAENTLRTLRSLRKTGVPGRNWLAQPMAGKKMVKNHPDPP